MLLLDNKSKSALRNFIEQEMRLAMQQEKTIHSSVDRAAIACVRVERIMNKLDGQIVDKLVSVPADVIKATAQSFLP